MLQIGYARWSENHQPWQEYQRAFFRAERERLEAEVDRAPAVKTLVFPDGKTERCLTCHIGIEEISRSHPVEAFGCTSCHGGDGLSLEKTQAHREMRGGRNPSDLRVAASSCGATGSGGAGSGGTGAGAGQCHDGRSHPENNLVPSVTRMLMASKAGEIGQTRFSFGLQRNPLEPVFPLNVAPDSLPSVLGGHPAEGAFRDNCAARCHLWAGDPKDPGRSFSGGCAACHYLYEPGNTYRGRDATVPKDRKGHGALHRLTTRIPYSQCNRCHNQGTHTLAGMKFQYREDLLPQKLERLTPEERRKAEYYIPGESFAKCEVTLDCIDCHTRSEVMGLGAPEGRGFRTKAEAQKIRCFDCHGTVKSSPRFVRIADPQDQVFTDPRRSEPGMPGLKVGDVVAVTSSGEKLPYVRFDNGKVLQYSKVTGQALTVPQVFGSGCGQSTDEQSADACHRCHDESKH